MQAKLFLPTAMSWYLDVVSPQWEALVSDDDYTFIMPLPVKKKLALTYLVQPHWTQQMGIISNQEINQETISRFISQMPYCIYAFNLNAGNHHPQQKRRNLNLRLSLQPNYDTLAAAYSSNTRRNITKALKQGITLKPIPSNELIHFWKKHNPAASDTLKSSLVTLINEANSHSCAYLIGAYTSDNSLVAALFALKFPHHITFLCPTSSPEGMRLSAMFLIVDSIIKEHSSKDIVFDFEGSMIPGVARFYRGFGATEQHYYPISRHYPERFLKLLHTIL